MKIGINALFLIPGEVGGTETYLRKTLIELPSIAPEHEFVIFANEENRNLLARDLADFSNVSIIDTKVHATSRLKRVLHEQFVLPKVVLSQKIDVLWNPGNICPLYKHTCPYVTTIHDMQYISYPNDFTKLVFFFMKHFTPKAILKSDAVVTNSEFARQEIVQYSKVKVDRVHVVLPGVTQNFSEHLEPEFIKERKIALLHSNDPYLLVVANSYPHKSIETAIEAFGKLNLTKPLNLVILGRPRLGEPAVQTAIEALQNSERIIRLHHVVESDLRALYQGAAAFVFPSRYEGFGLPVLEGMCARTPVIAARNASIPEVGGDTIEYFNGGDYEDLAMAIKKVLNKSEAQLNAQITAQAQRATRFNWKDTAKNILALLVDTAKLNGNKNSKDKQAVSSDSKDGVPLIGTLGN
ncbi:MAG: glycosyltransferase family 4 protein [Kiritimatiellae bacterium]|nr:glycosyltransferase family 4 protein [Kiritimatiellia bacterium]